MPPATVIITLEMAVAETMTALGPVEMEMLERAPVPAVKSPLFSEQIS